MKQEELESIYDSTMDLMGSEDPVLLQRAMIQLLMHLMVDIRTMTKVSYDVDAKLGAMDEKLQAIDWKLWELHQKAQGVTQDAEPEAVAAKPAVEAPAAPAKAKRVKKS